MPTFQYKGYHKDGKQASGSVAADTIRDAKLRLKSDGILPTEINPENETTLKGHRKFFKKKISSRELALMTRRLATLLGASMPLYVAATTLMEQEQPGQMQQVLSRVRERLAEGLSLAKALAQEPAVFNESYVSMVSAGEVSGSLELVLERLAEFLEEQEAVKSKIATALAYPILMTIVGTGVMIFLLAFVIPKITTVFADNKAALPIITVILIKISAIIRKGWWVIVIIVIALNVIYKKMIVREEYRLKKDRIILKLPGVGSLTQKLILSRFARILGLLLSSGVPVIKAMEITGEAVVNRAYRSFISHAKNDVIEGGKLSAIIAKSSLFPPLLVHMIGIGEQSGNLDEMLEKAGTAFEKEFETSIARFMSLLEPCMVLGMGLSVGFVVIAVLLPIFELNQMVK
ncbi:MAG: type II secretion system inner membrane protein GspF [Desulfuromonadales bacterium]|nr:type II secretion system inner membrane protein GspF [Desulfuromonadales bacterium]